MTSAPAGVLGLFPLDERLHLRRESWSAGVVRAMTWLGATQRSSQRAAARCTRLPGGSISDTRAWRITNQQGSVVARVVEQEAAAVSALPHRDTPPSRACVTAPVPREEHATVAVAGVLG